MVLTVFGATGRIGGHIARQALDAGHSVIAVVRSSSRLEMSHARLRVVSVPSLNDAGPLRPALDGSDAALSGVGPRGRKDGPVASDSIRAILGALEASSVRRFVAVSAVPVGPVPDGESFLNRRLLLPFVKFLLRDVYADLALMEELICKTNTTWTIVRPPRLVDGPVTARYRTCIGANVPRGYVVSRADVAHAMLAAIHDSQTFNRPVGIAN